MKRRHLITTLIAAALLLPACNSSENDASARKRADGKLSILTTFLPIHAHAAAIAGDRAHVEALVTGDVGAHDFSPRPADIRRLANADLLVINGAGMEFWLDDLTPHSDNPNLKIIDLSKGVTLLENQSPLDQLQANSNAHAHCCGDGEHNPHIWLDPVIAIQQVETLRDALIAADPDGAQVYQQNTVTYLAKLRELDAEFRSVLDPLPSKKLITFHDAFPYLAKRYDLEFVGFVSQFPERDPAPAELASLIDRIRQADVKVLFAEVGYEPALLTRIAESTGARVSILDTLEVGTGGPDAYLTGMRNNLQALREAFTTE